MLIHHNLIFPDAPQEEVLEDLLPPVVAQDSNYTFSESEIEPENSTNDDDLPEILLGPRNVTAYLGKGPFKYYVSIFLTFFHPTHPPCKQT